MHKQERYERLALTVEDIDIVARNLTRLAKWDISPSAFADDVLNRALHDYIPSSFMSPDATQTASDSQAFRTVTEEELLEALLVVPPYRCWARDMVPARGVRPL
ncbi:MAG: hypothetical protein WDM91_11125 [Rhizomicrobium sp.]